MDFQVSGSQVIFHLPAGVEFGSDLMMRLNAFPGFQGSFEGQMDREQVAAILAAEAEKILPDLRKYERAGRRRRRRRILWEQARGSVIRFGQAGRRRKAARLAMRGY